MTELLFWRGKTLERRVPVPRGVIVLRIGRGARNDIDLPESDLEVSRVHAELRVVENRIILVDLKSQNGILVDGTRRASVELSPDEAVTIGPFRLMLNIEREPETIVREAEAIEREPETMFQPAPAADPPTFYQPPPLAPSPESPPLGRAASTSNMAPYRTPPPGTPLAVDRQRAAAQQEAQLALDAAIRFETASNHPAAIAEYQRVVMLLPKDDPSRALAVRRLNALRARDR